jgi:hypothetical protein
MSITNDKGLEKMFGTMEQLQEGYPNLCELLEREEQMPVMAGNPADETDWKDDKKLELKYDSKKNC